MVAVFKPYSLTSQRSSRNPDDRPVGVCVYRVAELTSSLVAKQLEIGNSNNMALLQKLGASSRLLRSAPSQLTWRRNMAGMCNSSDSDTLPSKSIRLKMSL